MTGARSTAETSRQTTSSASTRRAVGARREPLLIGAST
jgi:hypothetical protein